MMPGIVDQGTYLQKQDDGLYEFGALYSTVVNGVVFSKRRCFGCATYAEACDWMEVATARIVAGMDI